MRRSQDDRAAAAATAREMADRIAKNMSAYMGFIADPADQETRAIAA